MHVCVPFERLLPVTIELKGQNTSFLSPAVSPVTGGTKGENLGMDPREQDISISPEIIISSSKVNRGYLQKDQVLPPLYWNLLQNVF
jgi:hypothetical protein